MMMLSEPSNWCGWTRSDERMCRLNRAEPVRRVCCKIAASEPRLRNMLLPRPVAVVLRCRGSSHHLGAPNNLLPALYSRFRSNSHRQCRYPVSCGHVWARITRHVFLVQVSCHYTDPGNHGSKSVRTREYLSRSRLTKFRISKETEHLLLPPAATLPSGHALLQHGARKLLFGCR